MKHLINWIEIPVRDMDRACTFYGHILGVALQRMELAGGPDLAEILKKVTKAGGKVIMEKMWLSKEAGYAGVFVDSEGNSIGLQHM